MAIKQDPPNRIELTTTRISVIDDDESCPFGDDAEIIECIKTHSVEKY